MNPRAQAAAPGEVIVSPPGDGPAADRWDAVVAGSAMHLSSRWLRAVDTGQRERRGYRLHVDDGAGIAAVTVAYPLDDAGDEDGFLGLTRIDSLLGGHLRPGRSPSPATGGPLRQLLPSLSCGGWTLVNSTIAVTSAYPPALRRACLRDLVRRLTALARELGARSVSFPYVEQSNRELRGLLLAEGFVEFPSAAHCTLDVGSRSFDDYLAQLSQGRRRSVRRERARLAAAGAEFPVVPLEERLVQDLVPLAVGTVARHSCSPGPDLERHVGDRLRSLVAYDSTVTLAVLDGAIRGFGVTSQWRDHLYARIGGFDQSVARSLPLYFGVFYREVEVAIERRVRAIEYATTTETAKTSRGARRTEQYGYVQVLDPAATAVVRDLLRPSPRVRRSPGGRVPHDD